MASSNPVNKEDDPAYVGNTFFVRKEYEKALEAYTTAIEKFPDIIKLYSNRAMTYLRLGRPFEALKDADDGLTLDPDNEKLIYRKCKALLALRRFSDAGQFLDESTDRLHHLANNKDFKALINDVNRLKPEYEHGQYDLPAMNEESKTSKFLDNHADFYAWNKFEIREVDGKGRGLVAKAKIEAGELLIACKAFIFVEESELEAMGPIVLYEKTRKKLIDRPDLADEFYRLYAGPQLGHLEKWSEGESTLIDAQRIKSILCFNGFTALSCFDAFSFIRATKEIPETGLWLIPSYINHSCVDTNCVRYFVGDYMFFRATKSIERGEEILFSFVGSPNSFEKRQKLLRDTYDFDCQCRLCAIDRQDPIDVKQRMGEISKFMDEISQQLIRPGKLPRDIMRQSKSLLEESLQLRPQRDLNYLAPGLVVAVAIWTFKSGKNIREAIGLMMEYLKILESNGDMDRLVEFVKFMRLVMLFEGKEEKDKWKMETRRIAKLFYGDERMADLVFA